MKQRNKILSVAGLLILFIMYQASITAFTHVHYINGVMITHTHPFSSQHSHSQTSLLVIGLLPTLCSSDCEPCEVERPDRQLIAVIDAAPATPTAKGAIVLLSLRAPPMV